MNKARLLILAAAGLVLASCGHETLTPEQYESWVSEHSSAQPSSEPSKETSESKESTDTEGSVDTEDSSDSEGSADTEDSSDTEGSADTEGSTDTEDSSDTEGSADTEGSTDTEDSSDSGEEEEYLYFREATWWNAENVDVRIALDPTLDTTPETMINYADMEYLRYVYHDADDHYCYYAIALSSLEDVETIQFWRYGYEKDAAEATYWGAQTIVLTLADRGENNMYDIRGVDKPGAWTGGDENDRAVTGVWGVYDPDDEGVEPPTPTSSDSSEGEVTDPYGPDGAEKVSWYLVGEGTTFSGWSIETGLQLWENPNNPEDKGCALNVTFAVGDAFKVTDGADIWFGYEKVDPYEDPSNAGLTCFEGVNDGYGGKNFSCTVAGVYDMYVNKDGVFWIQVHA